MFDVYTVRRKPAALHIKNNARPPTGYCAEISVCTIVSAATWRILPLQKGRQYKFRQSGFPVLTRSMGTVLAWRLRGQSAPLPDYPINRVRTGQSHSRRRGELSRLWSSRVSGNHIRIYAQAYRSHNVLPPTRNRRSRGNFEVYFSENRLVYVKERCSAALTGRRRFYLHIVPQYAADLMDNRRQSDFNQFGLLDLPKRGLFMDGDCIAIAPLPDYPDTQHPHRAVFGIQPALAGGIDWGKAEASGSVRSHRSL